MKFRKNHFILTATSALLLAPAAFALDGTWTNLAGGSWSADTNWTGGPPGIIADGTGFTANFLDITADPTTVNLDGARTIGNLVFGDTDTGTAGSWLLANGTGGPLTLDGVNPTITVNALGANKNAQITANVGGTSGFTKAGGGVLILNSGGNTISGAIVLSAGTLQLNSASLSNATTLAINGGTLVLATTTANAIGADNNAKISFGGGTLQYNLNSPNTDYSARFSTTANQQYRINVISAGMPSVPRIVTYASDLASPGGTLTKLSTGTLILAAANTFTGSTTVSAGTLELSNAQALQNSAINTTASAAGTPTAGLVLTGVTSPTFGGLTGNKALSTLFDTDSGNYGLVTNVTLNPGTGASYSYAAAIADGAPGMTLTKSGAGTQTLTVANSYSGGTILSGGTLNYGNASALSSGSISFTGNSTLQAGVATNLSNAVSVATGVTGTVDTNGNTTTLSGAITGDGNLTKTSTGTLTLSGGAGNTLSGTINVNGGTLAITKGADDFSSAKNMPGAITVVTGATLSFDQGFRPAPDNNLANALNLSGSGTSANAGALHLFGNARASGAITLDNDATITKSFNSCFITGSITGADKNLTLKTRESGQPGLTVSAPISLGTGGITVAGAGGTNIVTLSGNNSYSGETHVVAGELKLTGTARVPNASTVRIDTGAVLHLDFADTDSVGALYLPGDPNPKPNGTYGSLTSTATNKSADFLGGGILQVGAGGGSPYATWAGGALFTDDANGDGVDNGLAWILGAASPTVSALNKLPQVGTPSGYLTLSFSRVNPYAPAKLYVEYSSSLTGWAKVEIPALGTGTHTIGGNIEVVVTSPGSPSPDTIQVKIPTLTYSSGGKLFARLSATEN